jgi:hypothetical protein
MKIDFDLNLYLQFEYVMKNNKRLVCLVKP